MKTLGVHVLRGSYEDEEWYFRGCGGDYTDTWIGHPELPELYKKRWSGSVKWTKFHLSDMSQHTTFTPYNLSSPDPDERQGTTSRTWTESEWRSVKLLDESFSCGITTVQKEKRGLGRSHATVITLGRLGHTVPFTITRLGVTTHRVTLDASFKHSLSHFPVLRPPLLILVESKWIWRTYFGKYDSKLVTLLKPSRQKLFTEVEKIMND